MIFEDPFQPKPFCDPGPLCQAAAWPQETRMEPGCPGLRRNHLPKRWCGQKGGQAAGRQMCFPPVTPQASKQSQHLSSQPKEGAHGAGTGTRHSHEHQAAKGCGTAAVSQPGETPISEAVRLLPRTCTLLSNPPGCEVFQKQKVILLQSRKGHFCQPGGKTSGTTSTTAAENRSLTKG